MRQEASSLSCRKNIYARYGFKVVSDIECVCKSDVIIDALFGTGLKRAIEGSLADVISAVNKTDAYRVAVDVPSGVDSDKGHVMGCTFKADFTYTFLIRRRAFSCGRAVIIAVWLRWCL